MLTLNRGSRGALVSLALLLTACSRDGRDDMTWARRALERNDTLEVVATDRDSHSFTVRVRSSGELRVVRLEELVAAAPSAAAPGTSAGVPSPKAPAVPPTVPPVAAAASAAAEPEPPPLPATVPVPRATPGSLTPQRPGGEEAAGRVLEAGPGYSIKSSGAGAVAPRAAAASVTSSALERRHDPIVCQGVQLLHIDNRNLVFDGDAVSAEDGCEIHITNSRISAAGVGILARAARVYIDNSQVEGDQASIDASEGAQVYAAWSRFKGLSRRLDTAAFHDLGGNIWN